MGEIRYPSCLLGMALAASLMLGGTLAPSHAMFAGIQRLELSPAGKNIVLRFQSDLPFQLQRQSTSDTEIRFRLYNAQFPDEMVNAEGVLNIVTGGPVQTVRVEKSSRRKGTPWVDLIVHGSGLSGIQLTVEGATELPSADEPAARQKPVVTFPEISATPADDARTEPPVTAIAHEDGDDIGLRPMAELPQGSLRRSAPQIASVTSVPRAVSRYYQQTAAPKPVEEIPIEPQPAPQAATPISRAVEEIPAEPEIMHAMPRYEGGAPPIEARIRDAGGRIVTVKPISGPAPYRDLGSGTDGYNTLFQAEPKPDPEEQVNRLMAQAVGAYRSRNHDATLQKVQQALALQPKNADLLIALAEIQVARGELAVAEKAYQKALILAPQRAGDWRGRYAQVLVMAGRRREAIQVLEEIVRQDDSNAKAAYMLGTLHEQLGQTDKALPYLQKAAALTPDLPEVQYNLGLAYELTGQRDAAARHYEKALQLSPGAPDIRLALQRVKS